MHRYIENIFKSIKIIIHGTKLCPYCVELKGSFERESIEFEFIKLIESMPDMKAFLAYRTSAQNLILFNQIEK